MRTIRALLLGGHRVELIVSKHARLTLEEETAFGNFAGTIREWLYAELADEVEPEQLRMHRVGDQTASIASGSAAADGMIVVPCTAKTLAAIAHGYAANLIERAADVTLKEHRPLVLVFREAPYSLIHLRNMTAAAEAGARILPASPAFYQQPETFDDLGDFIAQRALSLVGIEVDLFEKWSGPREKRTR